MNSHLEVCVVDNGQGIKPEFLPHVFERFRQADASTTRRHGGLGLGLSIVKHLVELHGGKVRAKSAGEGQGATFCIELPLMVVHAPEADAAREHPRRPRRRPALVDHPSLRGDHGAGGRRRARRAEPDQARPGRLRREGHPRGVRPRKAWTWCPTSGPT